MLKLNLGFGSNFSSVAFHTNANFNGYEQPYPYAPIWYAAPAGGFKPAWAYNRNVVINMGGSAA
jgi:hypothetical protein